MTLIVTTLAGAKSLIHRARAAKRLGADLIELRIDTFPKNILNSTDALAQIIKNIKKAAGLPIISTIRYQEEQGKTGIQTANLTETERLDLFKLVAPLSDYIDIELRARNINREAVRFAHAAKKQVIVSYHNFQFTPPDAELRRLGESCVKLGADVVKIACMAKTTDDAARLLELTRDFKKRPVAAVSMGNWSGIARIAGYIFGSHLIYSYVGNPTAPGQPSLQQLTALLRSLSSLSPLRPKTKN